MLGLAMVSAGAVASAREPRVLAPISELFSRPQHTQAVTSPSGRFAASDRFGYARRDGKSYWHSLRIVEGESGQAADIPLFTAKDQSIQQILWIDEDSVLVTAARFSNAHGRPMVRARVVDVDATPTGIRLSSLRVPARGWVISALPEVENQFLFSNAAETNSVYRADLSDAAGPQDTDLTRVANIDDDVQAWVTDPLGRVRAAVGIDREEGTQRLWYRESASEDWRIVHTETDPQRFDALMPLAFAADGSRLLVASDQDRDRYGLYEYDPGTDALGELVYEHPTAQLTGVLFDYGGKQLLGVAYLEGGAQKFAYFDGADTERTRALAKAFPGQITEVTSLSRDLRKLTVRVSGPQEPGAFHWLDLDSGISRRIGRSMPWLENNVLSETRVFRVPSSSGGEMDAFLTLPPGGPSRPPLVVMPHGGPIGTFDLRSFQPEVQYLANAGLAVLRVNYRGSGGYGRRFEQAGRRQWGRGIEDDIDAAVDHAIEQGWVDGARICTAGASYGGYSALMLVIRRPGRYRCAASLSGVTDIGLLFNSSDWSWDQKMRDLMAELVGDPDADFDEQRRFSPVYNADKIRVPVHLAHGRDDRRVDVDHAHRMHAMLELHGVDVEEYLVSGMGHGFSDMTQTVGYYTSLRRFLVENLQPGG